MTRKQAIAQYATGALIIAAAACGGDRATAPGATAPAVEVRANQPARFDVAGDTIYASMVYHPSKGLKLKIGDQHQLFVPAYAICDTATSGYGPETWEQSCTPERRRVTITAKAWTDPTGHPFVQFSPDLRFSPDDKKATWLAMSDAYAARDSSARIVYCPALGGPCVDESLTDVEVATHSDKRGTFLYRRVKHLSGYNILSGYSSAAW